jgi:hypothetical protein
MSDEKRRSSLASTSAGGRPQGEHLAPASRLIEGHEQPLPSIESDVIDNLTQSTTCNLILLVGGSFRIKVRRGLVYPRQTMLDDVEIDISSYVVVKVDMVHENLKDLKLEVPSDDTTQTMRDAVTKKVQWRWTSIDVDPSAIASASTTPSQLNISPALIFSEAHLSPSPNPSATASASTTPSQPNTSPASIISEARLSLSPNPE